MYRVLKYILAAELVYLLLCNALLQLPLTQTAVNMVRPEKFHVSWERAWTWYPFRVHARGISANGQSRTQQWQLATPAASGSISLLPLVFKRVWVRDVIAVDISYRQRPRLRPDRDYDQLLPYFPDIEGREISAVETRPRRSGRPWKIAVDGLSASGHHSFWIYQLQGAGSGHFEGELTYQTRGGPFSLDAHELDLQLEPLYINDGVEVFKRSTLRGRLGFAPFVPRDNRGISLLQYLWLDADLQVELKSLDFINLFTGNFADLAIGGAGQVSGSLHYDRGRVLAGTDLAVASDDLAVRMLGLAVAGSGNLAIHGGQDGEDPLVLGVNYRDVQVTHQQDHALLLTGRDLGLVFSGDNYVLPDAAATDAHRAAAFTVDDLEVPDLALLQRYLPTKWPLQLHGGSGKLQGSARLTSTSVAANLRLFSTQADLGVQQYRFVTNLDAALVLDNPSILTHDTELAGSYLRLGESTLARDARENSQPWETSLEITSGRISILDQQVRADSGQVLDLLQTLGQSDSRQLLGGSRGVIGFTAGVSSLAWISVLLGEDYHARVSGDGTIEGEVHLDGGLPFPGTALDIHSEDLQVRFLDHTSRGNGAISLRVEEGGNAPDWLFHVALADADLRRSDEPLASIRNVNLELEALLEDVTFERGEKDFALQFRILSADVTDMSAFNRYLPPESPVQLGKGSADLTADLVLLPENASGWVKLVSPELAATVDGQSVSGDLHADIRVTGGVPRRMMFDVSGSQLRLDNVRIAGDRETFDQREWSAQFRLVQANTTWSRPPRLSAEAELTMSDSRPFVALFNNQGYRPKWLLELATLADIQGSAQVTMADDAIVIPMARIVSDRAEIRAKGIIQGESRDGMIYARYDTLDALLKLSGGRKNLDVIKVRETFDAYRPQP